jgi:ribosomal protein L29
MPRPPHEKIDDFSPMNIEQLEKELDSYKDKLKEYKMRRNFIQQERVYTY